MLLEDESMSSLPDAPGPATQIARRAAAAAAEREVGTETVLCATDWRQRPMMYLQPDEWAEFLRLLPQLREQLKRTEAQIQETDEPGTHMREYWLRRTYVDNKYEGRLVGRGIYGGQAGRSYFAGKMGPKARERLTRSTTKELAKYTAGDVR